MSKADGYRIRNESYADKVVTGKIKPPLEEIATRKKVDFYNLLGYLPDPDEILKASGKTFDTYRKIMIDSQIRSCCNSRKAGTKSLDWDIDRGRDNTPQGDLIKNFYRDNQPMIDGFIDDILRAPMFGFQPIEIIWGKVGEYILPVALKAKNQEWFMFNDRDQLCLLEGASLIGTPVPERKFLIPTYNDIHNEFYNPYGDRVLSSCFWPATFKRTSNKWWVTYVEKYGMPYLIGTVPKNATDKQKQEMKANLESMVLDAIAIIEEGTEINFETASKGQAISASSETYKDLVEQCDLQISKAILGQTLTTDSGQGGSGSYALGKVHSLVRRDILLSDKKLVEKTCNQLNKWIMEINFGRTEDIPKFCLYPPEDVDKEKAERDAILGKVGDKFKKDYFIKAYGIDKNDFDLVDPDESAFKIRPKDPSEAGKAEKEVEKDSKVKSSYQEFVEFYTDKLIAKFDDAFLQTQIKEVVNPIINLIQDKNSFEEVLKVLDSIKPDMDDFQVTNKLTQLIFLSRILGGADVADEIKDMI